jgi:hypothetical protein
VDGKTEAGVERFLKSRAKREIPYRDDTFRGYMGYYIRVLATKADQPALKFLDSRLRDAKVHAALRLETGNEQKWEQLVLAHPNGPEIALIEFNPVESGELGQEELMELIEEVAECQPQSASHWLKQYLPGIKTIYALQLLSGTDIEDGWKAVHILQGALWTQSGGILQSDGEGFTNEDGNHILWQFSDSASGKWKMAVLDREKWIAFEMELGNSEQREAFLQGRVPRAARLL